MLDKPVSTVRRLQELRAAILDLTTDGKDIAQGLVEIATNDALPPKDRLKAYDMLLDRAWGRVPQEIDVTASDNREARPLRTYSLEELRRMDKLMKLEESRPVVEGTIVGGRDA